MENIKNIGSVIGLIISAITLSTLLGTVFVKPIREGLIKWVQNKVEYNNNKDELQEIKELLQGLKKDNEVIKESSLCTLRNDITQIYYKHVDEKKFSTREKENLIKMNDAYKKLHGNTYIEEIYEETMHWEVYKG